MIRFLNRLSRSFLPTLKATGGECRLETCLMLTIDVEADSDKLWGCPEVLTFRNVLEAIPNRLHPLFTRCGIRPTYLISPEVLQQEACCAVLRGLGDCELGTHLHVENIAPEPVRVGPTRPRRGMQWECSRETERQKLQNLTQLFTDAFGFSPRSFRAGRFGIGHHTGKILMDLGYWADSSVSPHVRWTSQDGTRFPDFTNSPEMPYWVAADGDLFHPGNSRLLEIPLTINRPVSRLVTKSKGPVWFRPWYTSLNLLQRMVREVRHSRPEQGVRRPLVMMFHSMEIVPGASPYPQTDQEADEYLDILEAVLQTAGELGIKSCTMAEYWQRFRDSIPESEIPEKQEDGDA